jgi:TolB-like protein
MKHIRYPVMAVICLIFFVPSPASPFFSTTPEDLNEACKVLTEQLGPRCPSGKTVAVRDFTSLDRQKTLLSNRIQDLLTNALAAMEERKYRVVERLRLADLDTERLVHGDSKGDDLDQWARRLKADLVVVGTYVLKNDALSLSCRLVDPETGGSLAAAHTEVTLNRDIQRFASTPAPAAPMTTAMEALSPTMGSPPASYRSRLQLFRITHGKPVAFGSKKAVTLAVGEKMGFSVRPPMDSHLYIFNYDPQAREDAVIFVYPLPQIPPKVFLKEQTYLFPECIDPRAVSYPVEPPLGRMVFKVIGVESGQGHATLVSGLDGSKGYYVLHQKDLKGLISRLSVLPGASWWEESAEFWITDNELKN